MKTQFFLAALLCTATVHSAAPAETNVVRNAVARLQSASNYTWTATYRMATAGSGKVEGKADKSGTAVMTLEWGAGGLAMEMAIQGTNGALKREGAWRSFADLNAENPRLVAMLKEFKAPAAQAADLVKYAGDMKLEDGAYTASLSAAGVKELLSFGRSFGNIEVKNPKGSAKFWLQDGGLTKYEYELSGLLSIDGNERDLEVRATTELRDIGSTKVSLPEEARKKLGI